MAGPASRSLAASIGDFAEALRARWRIPGMALAVLHRGEPVHLGAYGVRDVDTGAPMTIDTAVAIASCAKAFTAAAGGALVDDGRIGWDDPIRTFLPSFRLYDPWVTDHLTLRDCLAHRIGIGRASIAEYGSVLSRDEVLARASAVAPVAAFRDRYCYSNLGYIAAAAAIGAAAGDGFEALVERRLFAPLGMRFSTVRDRPWASAPEVSAPHHERSGRIATVEPIGLDNLVGSGSIYSTARDMVPWLALMLGVASQERQAVSVAVVREMQRLRTPARGDPVLEGYGLGWAIVAADGARMLEHDGAVRGFNSRIVIDARDGFALFVAANRRSMAHHALARFVRQLTRGDEPGDWIAKLDTEAAAQIVEQQKRLAGYRADDPIAPTSPAAGDFAGTYCHAGLGRIDIADCGDHLALKIGHAPCHDGPLVRVSAHVFEYQGNDDDDRPPAPSAPSGAAPHIRFRLENGRAARFSWQGMWFGPADCVRTA